MNDTQYQDYAKQLFGVAFKDITLLKTALTHRSWLNENRKKRGLVHNERLEFLGDAVLELVVTHYLFVTYPEEAEGVMTNWRSALVRTESIGAAAEKLGLWDMLHLSRGEKDAVARAKEQILANAYEAVTGALYLDQGYEVAQAFIERTILSTLGGILEAGTWRDSKSRLQEQTQANEGITPTYKVLSSDGPDHEKIFIVGVYVGKELRGKGQGHSKQTAQQSAAENALGSD